VKTTLNFSLKSSLFDYFKMFYKCDFFGEQILLIS